MKRAGIHNPYWDSLGGGERYTAAFAKLLLDHGWQADVFWFKNISSQVHDRFGIDISQARFIKYPDNFALCTLNSELLFWLSDGSLPTSFAKKNIVHFQFPFQNIHGHSLINQIKSKFYKFIVNSSLTKLAIDKEFGVNSIVIYPPIDTSLFKPGKKQNIILYIGRFSNLTQLKGQSTLIESFRKIHKHLPGWKLILAGGTTIGTDAGNIEELKKTSSDAPIEIITDPSFKKIQKLCSTAKIFWSASGYSADKPIQTEHFGITVVEAMSAGAVPIITNLGGHPEIVDNGKNGYLWDTLSQLENITLQLTTHNSQLTTLSKAAIIKSRIFDISEFNRKFLELI